MACGELIFNDLKLESPDIQTFFFHQSHSRSFCLQMYCAGSFNGTDHSVSIVAVIEFTMGPRRKSNESMRMSSPSRPVFTSISTHGDDREFKAKEAQYEQVRRSKFVSVSKLDAFLDAKPRGPFTQQLSRPSNQWTNPAWNIAQGFINDPKPLFEFNTEDDRQQNSAQAAHRRRGSLDRRTLSAHSFIHSFMHNMLIINVFTKFACV